MSFLSRQIVFSELSLSCAFLPFRNQLRRKYCSSSVPNPSRPTLQTQRGPSSSGGGGGGSPGASSSSSSSSSAGNKVSSTNAAANANAQNTQQSLSLFQRFKSMYKDYYYVLIPVHLVTSIGWFGGFYHASKSGADIGKYLKKLGFSDGIISKVTESGIGHVAVAYALYKIATPARYTVTLGGTTWAINRLQRMGYIKPAKEIISKGKERFLQTKGKN